MALIHARLASKKASALSIFQLHAVGAICQAPDFYGLHGAPFGYFNVSSHGTEQFSYGYSINLPFNDDTGG